MAKAQAQSFASILDRAPSEIEKPKPLPQGSYITSIVGQPRHDKSSQKQTPLVEFQHKIISAGDDVDADELEAYLTMPDKTKKKLSDIILKNVYYTTDNAAWRLKDFLKHCGLNMGDEETGEAGDYDSLRQAVEDTPGKQVGIYVKHTPFQDGTGVRAEVGRTFVVE